MKCWINIHWPPPEGEQPDLYDKSVYLQDKHRHKINEFNTGDLVFIYETAYPPKEVQSSDREGTRKVRLRQPRKDEEGNKGGIVSLIKIDNSSFHAEGSRDKADGRDICYIGYFTGDKANCRRNFVPLRKVKEAWKKFNPLINGGLRELKLDECELLKGLVEFEGQST